MEKDREIQRAVVMACKQEKATVLLLQYEALEESAHPGEAN
jgi:hypothetical protein